MGKAGPKLSGFCLNRIRPNFKLCSPTIQNSKPEEDQDVVAPNIPGENVAGDHEEDAKSRLDDETKPITSNCVIGRKIMIVVDSSIEAKAALQWALSHTVQSQDLVVLLHVITGPTKQDLPVSMKGESIKERDPRAYELVNSLRRSCRLRRPEVEIEMAVVEGKEKGPLIVEEAKKQGVGLLVLGQKKKRSSLTWRLVLMMWATNKLSSGTVVDYCIHNADCMAIAVRRKSNKHGGYLITTKRHKDFWLLA